MYQDSVKEKEYRERQTIGKVDTSAFPERGCVVRGRSALCSVPLNVDVEGFQYKASVTIGLRLNPVNNTVTQSLYVDGFQVDAVLLCWCERGCWCKCGFGCAYTHTVYVYTQYFLSLAHTYTYTHTHACARARAHTHT